MVNVNIESVDVIGNKNFFDQAIMLLKNARSQTLREVNAILVKTYYEIGQMIVVEEQCGNDRAQYGSNLLNHLSEVLSGEFGKGFSVTNLRQMRQFYLKYQKQQTLSDSSIEEKQQTVSAIFKLSWSHYLKLMRIDDNLERNFYEIECENNNWSVRELSRQYDSALYARLSASLNKNEVLGISQKGQLIEKPKDLIKDPYILEFLGLSEKEVYTESHLEQEIINKLEQFLLELGKGFTFVARQKRISFDTKHFYIDLVFYNRILRSFVLVDLKLGELKHQDIGQMQMYVNYFDREIKLQEESKTIGIILCQDKSESVVKYTLPESNEQIFASKYKTVLPSKEELKMLISSQ